MCNLYKEGNKDKTIFINRYSFFENAEFNRDGPKYPCGISNGCYLLLNKKRNRNDVQLPINQTYNSTKKRLLRSDGVIRHCIICTVARSFGTKVANSKKKCGRP